MKPYLTPPFLDTKRTMKTKPDHYHDLSSYIQDIAESQEEVRLTKLQYYNDWIPAIQNGKDHHVVWQNHFNGTSSKSVFLSKAKQPGAMPFRPDHLGRQRDGRRLGSAMFHTSLKLYAIRIAFSAQHNKPNIIGYVIYMTNIRSEILVPSLHFQCSLPTFLGRI